MRDAAFIIFYLTDTNDTFGASGPVTILSVIYLFYGVISLILSKGQTVGEVLLNIRAVKIKTGKTDLLLSIIRIVFFSALLLLLGEAKENSWIYIGMLIVFSVPVNLKKKSGGHTTIINYGLGIQYVNCTKDEE